MKTISDFCRVCNEKESILLPICEIENQFRFFPVCIDCVDKVPYKIIPIKERMGELHIYCPERL